MAEKRVVGAAAIVHAGVVVAVAVVVALVRHQIERA